MYNQILENFNKEKFENVFDMENYLKTISQIKEEPKVFKLNENKIKEFEYLSNYLKIFSKNILVFSDLDHYLNIEKLKNGGVINSMIFVNTNFYDFNDYNYYFDYTDLNKNISLIDDLIENVIFLLELHKIKIEKLKIIEKNVDYPDVFNIENELNIENSIVSVFSILKDDLIAFKTSSEVIIKPC